MNSQFLHGDCQAILPTIPEDSIDLMVTDPPYGLKFMGKAWDKAVPSVAIWQECLRVLKPGAFAFIMCIPRQDCLARMIVNLEDAGFVVGFSSLYWSYASGFPKAQDTAKNINKDIDKYIGLCHNDLNNTIKEVITWQNNQIDSLKGVNTAERSLLKTLILHGMNTNKDSTALSIVLAEQDLNLTGEYLNPASTVGNLSKKNQIETGINTRRKNTVAENVLPLPELKKSYVPASNVGNNSNVLPPIQGKNIYIVVEDVGLSPKRLLLNVNIVVLQSENQNLKSFHLKIPFVPFDARTFLCGKITDRIKEGGVLKTENGNKRFWNEINIPALCVEVIEGLKHIILNQLKTFLPSGIFSLMESLTVTNVIITKSTMECLITNTVDILGRRLEEKANLLKGAKSGWHPKPAVEVILVVMKPLSEKTYVDQALKNGKGVTWLDEGRIPTTEVKPDTSFTKTKSLFQKSKIGFPRSTGNGTNQPQGRFPANLLVSDDSLNDSTLHTSGHFAPHHTMCAPKTGDVYGTYTNQEIQSKVSYGDSGSFSRYFSLDAWWTERLKSLPESVQKTFPSLIVPKPPQSEKTVNGQVDCNHPTVKPLKLMSYLVTLGSREGDIVLDPFSGHGTTAAACKLLDRHYLAIEQEQESFENAKRRVGLTAPPPQLALCF